jgi:hypothetical protein
VTISAVAGVAREEAGLASGLVNTSRLFGGALGLAVLAALATARTDRDLRHAAGRADTTHAAAIHAAHVALTNGFVLAFAVAAGFAAIGAVVATFGLPRAATRRERAQGEVAAETA